jgi:peptidoglycan/LPS O-acetylase OafA/YrhL
LLLVGIDRVENPTILVKTIYFFTGLQHEAVVVFFVISGFLIGGRVWDAVSVGKFEFTAYFISRFSRIYIVYLPSLLLVTVLNVVGYDFLSETRFYAERPLFPSGVSSGWSIDQIPCHLLGVQGVMCTPWGANPPLWSLGFEWVLYLTAPAIFYAALARSSRISLAVILLVMCDHEIVYWFLIWFAGTVAYVLSDRYSSGRVVGLAGVALSLAALVASRMKIVPATETDIAVAIGVAAAFSCRWLVTAQIRSSIIQRCARFSYSLYLIHLPVCLFFGAMLEGFAGWSHELVQPDAIGLGAFALIIAGGLLSAWLFAMATEDHTDTLKRLIQTRLRQLGTWAPRPILPTH